MGTALATFLSLAVAGQEVGELAPRFAPGELCRTVIRLESESTLERSRTFVDREEAPVPGPTTRTIRASSEVAYIDEVEGVATGELTGLRRTYTTTRRRSSMQMIDPLGNEHSSGSERSAVVLDVPLRFTRGEQGFVAELAEEARDAPDWLEGVTRGPDWSCLVPRADPEVGARWNVPVELLEELREPGGDLGWESVGPAELDRELVAPPGSVEYEGEIEATYRALEDGVACIALDLEASARLDLTPFLPEQVTEEHGDGPHVPTVESVLIQCEIEGRGEVLWDTRAGRMASLRLELESREVETVVHGHTRLAPGGAELARHDVEIVTVSESRIEERIAVEASMP